MYLKGLVTGVMSHSILENGRVLSAPSLHRESTDSLIVNSVLFESHSQLWQ